MREGRRCVLLLIVISLSFVYSHSIKFKQPNENAETFLTSKDMIDFTENGISEEATIITDFLEQLIDNNQNIVMNCVECKLVFTTVQAFIQSNQTEQILKEIAFKICLKLNIPEVTPLVCHGVVREFAEEVIYVFSERFLDPTLVCNALNICNSSFTSSTFTPSSSFDAIPSHQTNRMPKFTNHKAPQKSSGKSSASVGTFVHISDIHFDTRYKVGSSAECARPLCCRAVSDFPSMPSRAAGPWGDYNCDTPVPLLNNLLDHLNTLNPVPEFLLYAGDNTAHDIWAETQDMQLNRTVWLFNHIVDRLPNILFLPVLGNHEAFPVDQFPNAPENAWLMNGVADVMERWISNTTLSTFRQAGYYTTLIRSGLRFVGLNTQYCDVNNFWLVLDWKDPMDQLDWLNSTLFDARSNGEKVLMVGHIPMFQSGCLVGYSKQYWEIVSEYNDVIIAQFFGHTHEDSFQVYLDYQTNSKPVSVAYTSPSVTPYTKKNPTYRVYRYDQSTFEILDYDQYFLNLTEANLNNKITWQLEYSAKEAYSLPSLDASSWYDLVMNSFPVNSTLVNNFNIWTDASYDTNVYPCDDTCVKNLQCQLTSSTDEIYYKCLNTQPTHISWTAIMNVICP